MIFWYRSTVYNLPQNLRVHKVMSQWSMGACTHCTRANKFPVMRSLYQNILLLPYDKNVDVYSLMWSKFLLAKWGRVCFEKKFKSNLRKNILYNTICIMYIIIYRYTYFMKNITSNMALTWHFLFCKSCDGLHMKDEIWNKKL